jgi:DNA-binding NarL/FixJ family response regulator
MEERRTVVLYGNSLLMAGVEVSLKDQPALNVVQIDTTLPDVAQRLEGLQPDVVIFDLTTPTSNLHFPSSILQQHPDISLIGLDLNSSKVLVLSGQEHTVLAANDLAQVIQLLTRT